MYCFFFFLLLLLFRRTLIRSLSDASTACSNHRYFCCFNTFVVGNSVERNTPSEKDSLFFGLRIDSEFSSFAGAFNISYLLFVKIGTLYRIFGSYSTKKNKRSKNPVCKKRKFSRILI